MKPPAGPPEVPADGAEDSFGTRGWRAAGRRDQRLDDGPGDRRPAGVAAGRSRPSASAEASRALADECGSARAARGRARPGPSSGAAPRGSPAARGRRPRETPRQVAEPGVASRASARWRGPGARAGPRQVRDRPDAPSQSSGWSPIRSRWPGAMGPSRSPGARGPAPASPVAQSRALAKSRPTPAARRPADETPSSRPVRIGGAARPPASSAAAAGSRRPRRVSERIPIDSHQEGSCFRSRPVGPEGGPLLQAELGAAPAGPAPLLQPVAAGGRGSRG